MELQLSDVAVGKPSAPRHWSNQEQKYIETCPRNAFKERMHDFKADWSTKQITQSLFFRKSNINHDAAIYHKNYMEYLEKCWADHLGIVITPDIMWFTVLTELAAIVKVDPEHFRHLFSESEEKQDIVVITGELVEMPLSSLMVGLKEKVPTDVDLFMPKFSTTTERSQHAFHAAFCDMCSPYYDYSMLCCGFPAIDVRGTEDDWMKLSESWTGLKDVFKAYGTWFQRVQDIFDDCAANFSNADWWSKIFRLERCGSGGQTEAYGWYTDLFQEAPSVRYTKNFASCVAKVEYKQLNTQKNYLMQDGLFFSCQEGDFMVPDFGFTIHEKIEVESEAFESYADKDQAAHRFFERTGWLTTQE